jgi:hypothetical protein
MSDKSILLAVAARFAKLLSGRMHPEAARAAKIAEDFTPTTSGDWSPAPTTQDGALDQLAATAKSKGTNVTNLISLSGVAANAANLGAFTGSTIADNQTVKAAIQALETKAEKLIAGTHTVTAGQAGAGVAAISVPGVAASTVVVASMAVNGGTAVIDSAIASADTITVSGTLAENDVISYIAVLA